MAEEKEMELTSSHKYIKDTTTFGTSHIIPTGHWLKISYNQSYKKYHYITR